MRPTVVWLKPQRLAIARVLQCVASAGVLSKVSRTTRSICASLTRRGAPGRGSSSNPSSRRSTKRRRHLPTVCLAMLSLYATTVFGLPAADSSTIRERWASACALLGLRAQLSRVSHSSAVRLTDAIGLPVRISVLPFLSSRRSQTTIYSTNLRLRTLAGC
jgi:hypothetical protein